LTPSIRVQAARRTLVVSLAGEFDIATAAALRDTLESALAGGWRAVVVECSQVTFLDVVGGQPLAAASAAARTSRIEFFLVHPGKWVEQVLDLLGLSASIVPLERLPVPTQTAVRLAVPTHL
jgi:anti-anti-sigma factor